MKRVICRETGKLPFEDCNFEQANGRQTHKSRMRWHFQDRYKNSMPRCMPDAGSRVGSVAIPEKPPGSAHSFRRNVRRFRHYSFRIGHGSSPLLEILDSDRRIFPSSRRISISASNWKAFRPERGEISFRRNAETRKLLSFRRKCRRRWTFTNFSIIRLLSADSLDPVLPKKTRNFRLYWYRIWFSIGLPCMDIQGNCFIEFVWELPTLSSVLFQVWLQSLG